MPPLRDASPGAAVTAPVANADARQHAPSNADRTKKNIRIIITTIVNLQLNRAGEKHGPSIQICGTG